MKKPNYLRREWWMDDQRIYRTRHKKMVDAAQLAIAKEHGFEADTRSFDFGQSNLSTLIRGYGEQTSDWMLALEPCAYHQYFDGQILLVFTSDWLGIKVNQITYKKGQTTFGEYDRVYVMKSDYDWTSDMDNECNIDDLL